MVPFDWNSDSDTLPAREGRLVLRLCARIRQGLLWRRERICVNDSRRDLRSGFGQRESLVSSSRRSRPSRNHPDRTARRAQGRAASARRSGPLRASTVLLSPDIPTGGFGGMSDSSHWWAVSGLEFTEG